MRPTKGHGAGVCRRPGAGPRRGYIRRVSDLQCPARFLVVRHGEAAYEQPEVLSDQGGWLTERGRVQAAELAEWLSGERVAAAYTSRLRRAVETGEVLGDALGLQAHAVGGIQEFSVGDLAGRPYTDPTARRVFLEWLSGHLDVRCPGAETGEEVVARFVAALDELADRHRGETVVVVSHGGVMSLAIPHTVVNASANLSRDHLLANCAVVPIEVDSDGWRLVGAWPGVAPAAAEAQVVDASERPA